MKIEKNMEFFFGPAKTIQDEIREQKRQFTKIQTAIAKEQATLELNQIKNIAKIKQNAKEGKNECVKLLAIDISRSKKRIEALMKLKTQVELLRQQTDTIKTSMELKNAMAGITRIMKVLNRNAGAKNKNNPAVISRDFAEQSIKMEMNQEAIDEMLDTTTEEDEEADETVSRVLDELGITLQNQMPTVTTTKLTTLDQDDDLTRRLANLRK